MSNLLHTKEFKNIRTIHLLVGPACNMNCRHCQQMPIKNTLHINSTITDDVLQFLDNFIHYSQQEKFISMGKPNEIPCKIMFYGGEALLHLPLIQDIVTYFTHKYNLLSNYAFRFFVTTNGLAITKDFVAFANEFELNVQFSYDAPYPFAVRGYVSDIICNLVNQIKYAKIIAYGSAYNYDPLLAYKCLSAKFPNALLTYHIELFRTFESMPKDIDTYPWDKVRLAIRRLCISAKIGDGFSLFCIRNLLNAKIFPASNYFHNTKGLGVCICGNRLLSVTLTGEVMFCYNSSDVLGTIQEDTIESLFKKASDIWHKLYDKECNTCEGRDICYWGCAQLLRDRNNHTLNCEYFRKPYYRILREELFQLAKPLTKEEKLWFMNEEKIMKQQVKDFLNEGKRYKIEHTGIPKNYKN